MARWVAAALLALLVVGCGPYAPGATGDGASGASGEPTLPVQASDEPARPSPSLEVPPPVN